MRELRFRRLPTSLGRATTRRGRIFRCLVLREGQFGEPYPDLLPNGGASRPRYLPRLITALEDAGVPSLDTQGSLEHARREYPTRLLYHSDDSHWNGAGVAVVAEALAARLRKLEADDAANSGSASAQGSENWLR